MLDSALSQLDLLNGALQLRCRDLSAFHGDTQVLWDISLSVTHGEIVALVGSNGAGKTSLLGAISGAVSARGSIVFEGTELCGLRPDQIVQAGVVQVPQGRRLFGSLTVRDNLLTGAHLRRDKRVLEDYDRTLSYFPRLREREKTLAGRLSGGEQQQAAIARAMMSNPRLLLLDELSLGLAPVMVETLLDILVRVNASGVTLVLVEQDVQTALEFAQRAYVLEEGRVAFGGPARPLLQDPRIRRAYLGA